MALWQKSGEMPDQNRASECPVYWSTDTCYCQEQHKASSCCLHWPCGLPNVQRQNGVVSTGFHSHWRPRCAWFASSTSHSPNTPAIGKLSEGTRTSVEVVCPGCNPAVTLSWLGTSYSSPVTLSAGQAVTGKLMDGWTEVQSRSGVKKKPLVSFLPLRLMKTYYQKRENNTYRSAAYMLEEAHKSWPDKPEGVFHKSMEFVAHAHPWTAQRHPDEPELGQSHIQLSDLIADKGFQL